MAQAAERAFDPLQTKRRQILAGARHVFAKLGFERASVDEIAAKAGVSKATVYNHFEDKKALFVACFSEEVDEMRAGLRTCLGEPGQDVEEALQRIGEKVMAYLLSPAVSALYRHTIAEALRFPEIGQMLYDRGPCALSESLAAYLKRWDERGALRIDDPASAATQFLLLCQGDLVVRSRLGILGRVPEPEVNEVVRRAVRTFLRAYRA